ncbi:hypothetical protein BJV77DRAFT_1071421 [Russula vinacea]|nr:hypothetical protein BJV77DRAFT_1071421 [Russula vinacea]
MAKTISQTPNTSLYPSLSSTSLIGPLNPKLHVLLVLALTSPSPEKLEPEHPIEQSDVALCVISGQGELRCRDPPIVVNQEKGGSCLVFASFVSLPEEAFRLYVCNYRSSDVGADVSFAGEYLGKWLIAREPQAWHHIACDSLFQFYDSYDRQSKVFEPTTIEIKFQRLHKVEEGSESQLANLVPIIQRQPSPEDGPGFIRQSNDVMQSAFATPEHDHFLTFVISFYPPVPTTTLPPLSTTPNTSPEPELVSPTSSSSEADSTESSDSISQGISPLAPARLTPGFWGKLPLEGFCRRYELPEDIASVLTRMKVKDAHGLMAYELVKGGYAWIAVTFILWVPSSANHRFDNPASDEFLLVVAVVDALKYRERAQSDMGTPTNERETAAFR